MAILVFGVGQLVLPSLAAHVARQRLDKHGKVLSLSVSAFPAIELLFGDAGTVTAHLASYNASPAQMTKNLDQAKGVSALNVSIDKVTVDAVTIRSVRVSKRGGQFTGSGEITETALRREVPFLDTVTPISSSDGAVTLQGTASVPILGKVTADATVAADAGKVQLSAAGLLSSFLHVTVWSDPRVYVEAISGKPISGGMALSATWRLH